MRIVHIGCGVVWDVVVGREQDGRAQLRHWRSNIQYLFTRTLAGISYLKQNRNGSDSEFHWPTWVLHQESPFLPLSRGRRVMMRRNKRRGTGSVARKVGARAVRRCHGHPGLRTSRVSSKHSMAKQRGSWKIDVL